VPEARAGQTFNKKRAVVAARLLSFYAVEENLFAVEAAVGHIRPRAAVLVLTLPAVGLGAAARSTTHRPPALASIGAVGKVHTPHGAAHAVGLASCAVAAFISTGKGKETTAVSRVCRGCVCHRLGGERGGRKGKGDGGGCKNFHGWAPRYSWISQFWM